MPYPGRLRDLNKSKTENKIVEIQYKCRKIEEKQGKVRQAFIINIMPTSLK